MENLGIIEDYINWYENVIHENESLDKTFCIFLKNKGIKFYKATLPVVILNNKEYLMKCYKIDLSEGTLIDNFEKIYKEIIKISNELIFYQLILNIIEEDKLFFIIRMCNV